MEHKIIPATWKSKESLFGIIKEHEKQQWSLPQMEKYSAAIYLSLSRMAILIRMK
ncbi:MAG: hypothetical protein J7K40_10225 [candidate division Zixibacteria bacterium]|nr:hypothetical protein [candidate division Zixibacteria bacterium]